MKTCEIFVINWTISASLPLLRSLKLRWDEPIVYVAYCLTLLPQSKENLQFKFTLRWFWALWLVKNSE